MQYKQGWNITENILTSWVRDFIPIALTVNCDMGGSPGDVGEQHVMQEKQKKGWRMNCDVGEAMEGLENEL